MNKYFRDIPAATVVINDFRYTFGATFRLIQALQRFTQGLASLHGLLQKRHGFNFSALAHAQRTTQQKYFLPFLQRQRSQDCIMHSSLVTPSNISNTHASKCTFNLNTKNQRSIDCSWLVILPSHHSAPRNILFCPRAISCRLVGRFSTIWLYEPLRSNNCMQFNAINPLQTVALIPIIT